MKPSEFIEKLKTINLFLIGRELDKKFIDREEVKKIIDIIRVDDILVDYSGDIYIKDIRKVLSQNCY